MLAVTSRSLPPIVNGLRSARRNLSAITVTSSSCLTPGQQHREHGVRAEPRDRVALAQRALERERDAAQQVVRLARAHRLADRVEAVDPELHDRELVLLPQRVRDGEPEPVVEAPGAREPGERVVIREPGHFALEPLPARALVEQSRLEQAQLLLRVRERLARFGGGGVGSGRRRRQRPASRRPLAYPRQPGPPRRLQARPAQGPLGLRRDGLARGDASALAGVRTAADCCQRSTPAGSGFSACDRPLEPRRRARPLPLPSRRRSPRRRRRPARRPGTRQETRRLCRPAPRRDRAASRDRGAARAIASGSSSRPWVRPDASRALRPRSRRIRPVSDAACGCNEIGALRVERHRVTREGRGLPALAARRAHAGQQQPALRVGRPQPQRRDQRCLGPREPQRGDLATRRRPRLADVLARRSRPTRG